LFKEQPLTSLNYNTVSFGNRIDLLDQIMIN
jgi:hypothetical protein